MSREEFISSLKFQQHGEETKTSRDRVSEFVDTMIALRENGINTSKIKQTVDKRPTVVEDIQQDGINIAELCEKCDISMDYPIGNMIKYMRAALRGQGKVMVLTEQQKEDVYDALGSKKPAMQELIEILQVLKKNGVDTKNLQVKYRKENVSKTLKLSEYSFSDRTMTELQSMNYDEQFPLGKRILEARELVSGKKSNYKYSEEQRNQLLELVGKTRDQSDEFEDR